MADIFEELVPRLVLNTETDADSPDNETTYDGLRKLIEGFMMSMIATGVSGTVTGISTDTLSDTGNFTTDQCNGWVVIITSGDAIGNFYTIDDTTTDTIVCTGDDLETDGVAIGDTYIVLYDFVSNADGHDHDAINSKAVGAIATGAVDQDAIAASAVGQGELKSTTAEVTVSISSTGSTKRTASVGGGQYAFGEYVKATVSGGSSAHYMGTDYPSLGSAYVRPRAGFQRDDGTSGVGYFRVYYVQASGELHWVFLLMNKGEIVATWQAPDHPTYGYRGKYEDHPFSFPFNGLDEKDCEIICVVPTMEQVQEITSMTIPANDGEYFNKAKMLQNIEEDYSRPILSFIDIFLNNYELEKEADWPDIPVTVALPATFDGQIINDWRFIPRMRLNPETGLYERIKVKPIKKIIKKPDNVTCLSIKEKR